MDSHSNPAGAGPLDGPVRPVADARKRCTCDGAGRGPGRACVVKAGERLGELWRCADGWGRERPNSGGRWMWASGGLAPVALRLTEDGSEVAPPDDDDFDGTPQYYWEQTPTDQKHMPGLWKRA